MKQEYIEKISIDFSANKDKIILVDNSADNIENAKSLGCKTILVPEEVGSKDSSYIQTILAIMAKIVEQENVKPSTHQDYASIEGLLIKNTNQLYVNNKIKDQPWSH